MAAPELSILMPVFNEEATLTAAIDEVLTAAPADGSFELIVIDDASTDRSPEILKSLAQGNPQIRTLRHVENRGKGIAIQTGLREARGTYTAILDADLEYRASELDDLLDPLKSGRADAVFGVRGFEAHSSFSFWYVMGNKGVTLAANVVFNCWLSDIMTCHKVMPTTLFRSLSLKEWGFAIEPEITARLIQSGASIYEVPVSYSARSRDAGKKLTSLDGFRVLKTLIRCRLTRPVRRTHSAVGVDLEPDK
jgi:glycosyltransferase involved in cell wall biosynthesis